MDYSNQAQPDTQDMLDKLKSMFGGAKKPDTIVELNGAKDTSQDSAPGEATAAPTPAQNSDGFLGALKNLMQFFQAKRGSASNDDKYQKILTEAGIPASQTGIGNEPTQQ